MKKKHRTILVVSLILIASGSVGMIASILPEQIVWETVIDTEYLNVKKADSERGIDFIVNVYDGMSGGETP